ncbi:MAG: FAD:protein FMN transferase [Dysgonamonadaceae bacterium]|jgi:thiamine biosynthesis lipoprotein|nr:FAD:protein FMN transferase [Dysgonamonadaceae bacterium]
MMKSKRNTIYLLFLFLIVLTSCREAKQKEIKRQYYHTQIDIFNTSASVKYEYYKELGNEITARLDSFNLSLNPFNNQSIIYKVNNNIDVDVDDWFIACFNKSLEVSEKTGGLYDITAAPLINLWGFGFEKQNDISPRTIDSLKQCVGYEKIKLNGRKILKAEPCIQLNASSIAKGYSCDLIAEMLDNFGIENYMIEIGGEITVKGKNPNGRYWAIGITRPEDDNTGTTKEIQEIVYLNNRSLATSGNYRNYYVKNGQKLAHIINPKTGYPSGGNILSASVFASDCMTADAYATAFMVLGLEKAVELADQIPDLDYLFIYSDENGKLKELMSEGFEKYQIQY